MPSLFHSDLDQQEFENIREYVRAYENEREAYFGQFIPEETPLRSTWLHETMAEIRNTEETLDPTYEY